MGFGGGGWWLGVGFLGFIVIFIYSSSSLVVSMVGSFGIFFLIVLSKLFL